MLPTGCGILYGYFIFFPHCILRNLTTGSEAFIRVWPTSDYTISGLKLAPEVGLAPTPNGLTDRRATLTLLWNILQEGIL